MYVPACSLMLLAKLESFYIVGVGETHLTSWLVGMLKLLISPAWLNRKNARQESGLLFVASSSRNTSKVQECAVASERSIC